MIEAIDVSSESVPVSYEKYYWCYRSVYAGWAKCENTEHWCGTALLQCSRKPADGVFQLRCWIQLFRSHQNSWGLTLAPQQLHCVLSNQTLESFEVQSNCDANHLMFTNIISILLLTVMQFCTKYTFYLFTRFKPVYVILMQTILSLAKIFLLNYTTSFLEWTILFVCLSYEFFQFTSYSVCSMCLLYSWLF